MKSKRTGLHAKDVTLIKKGGPLEFDDAVMQVRWVIHPFLYRTDSQERIKTDWEHSKIRWVKPEELNNFSIVPKLKEALN